MKLPCGNRPDGIDSGSIAQMAARDDNASLVRSATMSTELSHGAWYVLSKSCHWWWSQLGRYCAFSVSGLSVVPVMTE